MVGLEKRGFDIAAFLASADQGACSILVVANIIKA